MTVPRLYVVCTVPEGNPVRAFDTEQSAELWIGEDNSYTIERVKYLDGLDQ